MSSRSISESNLQKGTGTRQGTTVSVQFFLWKSRDNTAAHFKIAAHARTDEFYERFWRISRCWIEFLWKVVSRFQSTWKNSEFSRCSAATKDCRLIHAINQDNKKTFFANQFSTFDTLKIFLKQFHLNTCAEIEKLFLEIQKWRQVWQVETDKIVAQIPMPVFATKRWLWVPKDRLILCRTMWSDSKRQQISELQYDKFPNPQSFMTWKQDSKDMSQVVLIFSIECYVVDQRSGEGSFFGWTKILKTSKLERFFRISRC